MTHKSLLGVAIGLLSLGTFAMGQALPPYNPQYSQQYPAPQYPAPQYNSAPPQYGPPPVASPAPRGPQMSPQMLSDMLRSAATFHELIRNMNLPGTFGPDQHVIGPDGRPVHSIQRTAQIMGAGAGIGAAIGEMSHKENAVMIGALIGGIGGLIADQVMKEREEARIKAAYGPGPDGRYPDGRYDNDRDRDGRPYDNRQLQTR